MRARTATILGSAVLHLMVGAAAVYYAGQPKPKKPHSVAVMGDKKKEPPKPKETPPPPPPRPKVASREIASAPEPVPIKETAPRPSHPAPVSPGTMSNAGPTPGNGGSGGAGGTGGGNGPASGDGTGGARPAIAAKKPSGNPDDECTEAPTKASPANRATEIEYTQEARANGVEGRLVLKVIIGADGSVSDVIVVSSVDPALDAAAIAAVKTWTFKPAMRCGKAMAGGTYTLAQRFELGD